MDLFSITLIASLFFGAVIGNAAYFGNQVRVQISVPAKLEQMGFSQATAERIFWGEAERIERIPMIVPAQELDLTTSQNLLAALAKPLNLDGAVRAVQQNVRVEIASVDAAILTSPTGPGLQMIEVVSAPGQPPVRLQLTQDDGDAMALTVRGTKMAVSQFAPYRLACSDLDKGMRGDAQALADARDTAKQALARPYAPGLGGQRMMMWNILALIDAVSGDLPGAEDKFRHASAEPTQPPWGEAIIAFNRAFLAVSQKDSAAAQHYVQEVRNSIRVQESMLPPIISAHWMTLQGLVAWSAGDLDRAEKFFRASIVELGSDPEPHFYLAQLLSQRGDPESAKKELSVSITDTPFHVPALGTMQEEFWTDPVKGGLKRRRGT